MDRKFVTVYCSHATHLDPSYYDNARDVGYGLADAGYGLVYGGASNGLMGVVADAMLERDGHVVGVIPNVERLMEVAHPKVTQMVRVEEMWERKRYMYQNTNAFVVLPGGYGTLDEVFEVLTLRKVGIHNKPVYFMNHQGFWNPMHDMLEKFIEAKTMNPEHRAFYQFVDSVPQLMELLEKDFTAAL